MAPNNPSTANLPLFLATTPADWIAWLEAHHPSIAGVWLQIAKKGSGVTSVTYDEALEVALCFGWIDGQKQRHDETFWLQKFTPRRPNSIWSKVNRAKVERLIAHGAMRPAGMQAVEHAKQNGRWEAAYDSHSTATVPADFQTALDANPNASAFFATLNSQNRYAILFRIQTAKKAETRTRRINEFVAMLERHEKLYP